MWSTSRCPLCIITTRLVLALYPMHKWFQSSDLSCNIHERIGDLLQKKSKCSNLDVNWAFKAWPVIIPISRLVIKSLHIRGVKLKVFLNYILFYKTNNKNWFNCLSSLHHTTCERFKAEKMPILYLWVALVFSNIFSPTISALTGSRSRKSNIRSWFFNTYKFH